jgi:fermentation-respiration switch protein FrsA (DUF1100 family)
MDAGSAMRTVVIVAVLVAAGLYGSLLALLAWQQRRFIYVPDRRRPDVSAAGVAGILALRVRTQDGLDLLAWVTPAADERQPVVLYLHGNGGHIGYRAPRLAWMTRLGWGVMLLEYRGFGGNPGSPTEAGLYEDARAGYAALRAQGVAGRRIVVWGESLGTGVAVRLAGEAEVGAVVLESPYTSILSIGQARFPFMPVGWVLRDRFDLIGRIGAVRAPLLVLAGEQDAIIPLAMSRAVFAAAGEPKMFWLAHGAGHNGIGEAGGFAAIRSFIEDYWTLQR